MASPELPQRKGHGTIRAIDPSNGSVRPVFVSLEFASRIAKQGAGKAMEFKEVVTESLLSPTAIFQGLRLDHPEIDEDDWFCYVARPEYAYDYKTSHRRAAWFGEVMLICVTSDWVVYNWNWYKSDPNNPNLPIDFETRFRKRVL